MLGGCVFQVGNSSRFIGGIPEFLVLIGIPKIHDWLPQRESWEYSLVYRSGSDIDHAWTDFEHKWTDIGQPCEDIGKRGR